MTSEFVACREEVNATGLLGKGGIYLFNRPLPLNGLQLNVCFWNSHENKVFYFKYNYSMGGADKRAPVSAPEPVLFCALSECGILGRVWAFLQYSVNVGLG